jgi:hypothetical protein
MSALPPLSIRALFLVGRFWIFVGGILQSFVCHEFISLQLWERLLPANPIPARSAGDGLTRAFFGRGHPSSPFSKTTGRILKDNRPSYLTFRPRGWTLYDLANCAQAWAGPHGLPCCTSVTRRLNSTPARAMTSSAASALSHWMTSMFSFLRIRLKALVGTDHLPQPMPAMEADM